MRLYCFSHFMLSTMAKGIQALHSTVEMFNKYEEVDLYDYAASTGHNPTQHIIDSNNRAKMLYDWSTNHKTCVVLNGGVSSDLNALEIIMNTSENKYPWAGFYEDESLGNLLTSLSIVLPERIYEAANMIRKYPKYVYFIGWKLYCEDITRIPMEEVELFERISKQDFTAWEQDFVAILITSRLAS